MAWCYPRRQPAEWHTGGIRYAPFRATNGPGAIDHFVTAIKPRQWLDTMPLAERQTQKRLMRRDTNDTNSRRSDIGTIPIAHTVAALPRERPVGSNVQETQMRKIGLFAVAAALTLVGVGGWMEWATSTSQARIAAPASDSVDPTQLTMSAKGHLPVAEFVDYTLQFPKHER
jgi:hypothetical protein